MNCQSLIAKAALAIALVCTSFLQATEIRAFCEDLPIMENRLSEINATFKGEYCFTDYIYIHTDNRNLNEEFFRIRSYGKTNWDQKPISLTHKATNEKETKYTIFSAECCTWEEATSHIPNNFEIGFCFFRRGMEFTLGHLHIFLEEIEGLSPSIEVIGPSYEDIMNFFHSIEAGDLWKDSVPSLIQKTFY